MASKHDHDSIFFIVNVVLIVSGIAFLVLRFGLANDLPLMDREHTSLVADLFFATWVGVIVIWCVMVIRRRRRKVAQRKSIGTRALRRPVANQQTQAPNPLSVQSSPWSNSVATTHLS